MYVSNCEERAHGLFYIGTEQGLTSKLRQSGEQCVRVGKDRARDELLIDRPAIGQQAVDPERLPPAEEQPLNLRHSETRCMSTQTAEMLSHRFVAREEVARTRYIQGSKTLRHNAQIQRSAWAASMHRPWFALSHPWIGGNRSACRRNRAIKRKCSISMIYQPPMYKLSNCSTNIVVSCSFILAGLCNSLWP